MTEEVQAQPAFFYLTDSFKSCIIYNKKFCGKGIGIMDFKEYALSHQNNFCLELERVSLLLKKAGNPDKTMKIIHVAGTNGKGSVCSFVTAGLVHGRETVGRFSSPELFDVTDTITVNLDPITFEELDEMYDILSPLSKQVEEETGKPPSQFEINFVAALLYFKKKSCSYAVIECGMGGAGDATNAIGNSYISVITAIGADHEKFLGNTLEEITANKCGIFKSDSVVITGAQNEGVMTTILRCAGEREVTVAQLPEIIGFSDFCEKISFGGEDILLSLPGVHQVQNAAIAATVLRVAGFESTVKYALEHAVNPARLEKIDDNLFFDGAHNPDGVETLVKNINRYMPDEKYVFVTGFMADKDYRKALNLLKNLTTSDFEIFTVNVHSNPRSETSSALCEICLGLGFKAQAFDNVNEAISEAKKKGRPVFVFGSLYMYKEVESNRR